MRLLVVGCSFMTYECYAQSLDGEFGEIIRRDAFEQKSLSLDYNKTQEDKIQESLIQKHFYSSYLKNSFNLLPSQDRHMFFEEKDDSTNIISRNSIVGNYFLLNDAVYYNLMHRRTAIFGIYLQNKNVEFEMNMIANRYETLRSDMQFGVSSFMQYRFSPHWSMGLWGTLYNHHPYFNMAAFPFTETSSWGGWIKYEDEHIGLKLGSRSYYDSFQRRWHWDPIITPSVKIGKKIILDVPVGPLVKKSMERMVNRRKNSGPTIMPDFK